jgi:hypothetical protein
MAKSEYEGYTSKKAIVRLWEKFGSAGVYKQKAQSILTKATGYIGSYDFTLNPYRGYQYGCSYCYTSAFRPNPRMRRNWGKWVLVKENAVQRLETELAMWFDKHPQTPPSIYMSLLTLSRIEFMRGSSYGIPMLRGYVPRISIAVMPVLPTLPEDEPAFLHRLQVAVSCQQKPIFGGSDPPRGRGD